MTRNIERVLWVIGLLTALAAAAASYVVEKPPPAGPALLTQEATL